MEHWEEKEKRAKAIKQKKESKRLDMFKTHKSNTKRHMIAELRRMENDY